MYVQLPMGFQGNSCGWTRVPLGWCECIWESEFWYLCMIFCIYLNQINKYTAQVL